MPHGPHWPTASGFESRWSGERRFMQRNALASQLGRSEGVQIMRDKIRLDQVERSIKEIEQALLKMGQESCPTLYPDEFEPRLAPKTEAPGRDLTNGPATTMTTCPHCHQPIDDIRLGVRLTPLKAAIVDRIKAAGDIGTTTTEIVDDVYRDRSPV